MKEMAKWAKYLKYGWANQILCVNRQHVLDRQERSELSMYVRADECNESARPHVYVYVIYIYIYIVSGRLYTQS